MTEWKGKDEKETSGLSKEIPPEHSYYVFLPRKSHGQRNLGRYSPWGHKSQTQLRDYTTITKQL